MSKDLKKTQLLIIGAPGSGKGTQASRLKDDFGLSHISSGDVLRSEVSRGTEFGKKIKEYMDRGEIGPVELITDTVLNFIDTNASGGFILDGFPRVIYQAEKLDEKYNIDAALFIDVAEEEVVMRITGRRTCKNCSSIYHIVFNPSSQENICDSCGGELIQRSDDNEETIKKRMSVYLNDTMPIVDFYEKKGILKRIDGNRNPDEIYNEIVEIIC